jgi:glutaredoxin
MTEQKPVKVFALSTCGHCQSARKFLDTTGISYDCTEVDLLEGKEQDAALKEMSKYNPRHTFPTIVIGDRIIIGDQQDEIREALGL